jgi:hypothetical protein
MQESAEIGELTPYSGLGPGKEVMSNKHKNAENKLRSKKDRRSILTI